MQSPTEFGAWLRQLRTARDLTQEALAELVGCAGQTLRSFEIGRRRPSREMVVRLANVLDIPENERVAFLRLARVPLNAPPSQTAPSGNATSHPTGSVAPRVPTPSLPADALIGRYHEAERLRYALLVEQHRLITLLGPGGVGKTRLALHTAVTLAPDFVDGAVVVALAAVRDVDGVVATAAAAVGCPLAGVANPLAALVAFLRDRTLLLVLDNLEHLLIDPHGDAIADLLLQVLRVAPNVALLVTSRERLRLQSEWVVELGGLGLPADDQPDTIIRADAVLLFVARAQRITRAFSLDTANQQAVAAICRRLDGLPLAIELAAAQVAFLPPQALLQRLDQVLPLLEGGARDLPQRQRTMRATIQWSYDLLPEVERAVFERLGVLVGTWSLPAAEAVGTGGIVAPMQVLPLLRRLVDRSLVGRDDVNDVEARYRLLEPVRQFALEQLSAHPVELLEAQQRHAAFFAALVEQFTIAFRSPQPEARFTHLVAGFQQEYPNVRAAIVGALVRGEVDMVVAMSAALAIFWWYRSQPSEPRGWMEAVLARSEQLAMPLHSRALLVLLSTYYGGDPNRSLRVGHEALALFEQSGDVYEQSYTLLFMGLAYIQGGDVVQAKTAMQRAYELAQNTYDPWLMIEIACNLGLSWAFVGDYERSITMLEATLATAKSNRDTYTTSHALFNLAVVAVLRGDVQPVADASRAWLAFMPEIVAVNGAAVSFALEGVAAGAALSHAYERAARLFGASDALRALAGSLPVLPSDNLYQQAVTTLRQQLTSPHLVEAWATGRALSVAQAVAEALSE